MFLKQQRHKFPKLTKSCEGQLCKLRISPDCLYNQSVPCHVNLNGSGMGTKVSDLFIVDACYNCHQILDGHAPRPEGMTRQDVLLRAAAGMQETQQRFLDEGLLRIKTDEGKEVKL